MRIGILAAGKIAGTMAQTLWSLHQSHSDIRLEAIASRSLERAQAFAAKYSIPKAYGSYEELAADPSIDLIYIASPHSEHYAHAMLCLQHKKALLVEKSFTVNTKRSLEVLEEAKKQHVLVTEAIWTRYMPSRNIINEAIAAGKIGRPYSIQANLGYPISHIERLYKPELAGGALLDVGIYPINFALMVFGHNIERISGSCIKSDTGVDFLDSITLDFGGERQATLHASAMGPTDRTGFIFGTTGYLAITNINNPEKIEVFNTQHEKVEELALPKQITGYEYEILACQKALKEHKLECPEMPHQDTIDVMKIMDELRRQWNIVYPCE